MSAVNQAGLPEDQTDEETTLADTGADSRGQVIELATRRASHDRLPAKFFGAPPLPSLYHTQRAEDARQRAEIDVPNELAVAVETLIGAGLRRVNVDHKDVADHNSMTLAYALRYAAYGLHVIDSHAIDPRTGEGSGVAGGKRSAKIPRGSKWGVRASNDPAKIVDFWTGNGEYPETKDGQTFRYARIGAPRNVSITFPVGSKLLVVDEDGEEGMAAVRALEAEHGELPRTATSISGSGKGQHRMYKTKRPIANTGSKLAPKVDIRGEGGQIIAAPSVHASGGYYRWQDDCAPWEVGIADAPEWLEELAFNASSKNAPKASKGKAARSGTGAGTRNTSYPGLGFDGYLADIGDGDGQGAFHYPIYSAACSWWGSHPDGDADELHGILREAIDAAPRDATKDRSKYDTEAYLSERIEEARCYIAANREEDAPEPEGATRRVEAPEPVEEDLEAAAEVLAEATADPDSTSARADPTETAATFTTESTEAEITAFLTKLFKQGADKTVLANVAKVLTAKTNLSKHDINATLKTLKDEQRAESRERKKGEDGAAIVNEWDFTDVCTYARQRIMESNARTPTIFHYAAGLVDVRADSEGRMIFNNLDKDGFGHHVNRSARFARVSAEGDKAIGVACPYEVVTHLYAGDYSLFPSVAGIVSTPVFTQTGSLLTQPGYDKGSRLFYAPGSFTMKAVSKAPTPAEVAEAREWLVEGVLGDFSLDGWKRAELVDMLAKGEALPSVAHALSFILLPFMRSMIVGPTPAHAFNKAEPGSGASLLINSLSTIVTGTPSPATDLPDDKAEMAKLLLSVLLDGRPIIYFDNINSAVNSGPLASVLTAPTFSGRVLGKSETSEIAVNAIFGFAGNKLKLSGELARRTVLITLDPKTSKPGKRDRAMFTHNLSKWVPANRGDLVWACLTLIQNWVAQGKVEQTEEVLASYENWSGIMGGIIGAAGIKGFLGNRDEAEALHAADDDPETMLALRIGEEPAGTIFVSGAVTKGTLSIRNLLETFYEDDDEHGKLLKLPGWGYKDDAYGDTRKIGVMFKAFASRRWRMPDGRDLILTHSVHPGTNSAIWTSSFEGGKVKKEGVA